MSSKKTLQIAAAFERQPDNPSVSEQNSPLSRTLHRFDIADAVAERSGDQPSAAVSQFVSAPARPPNPAVSVATELPDDLSPAYRAWCLREGYTPGQTIEVPLASLKETAYNPRHFYPPKLLEPLVASIAEQRQQQPIHVIPDYENPGHFYVSDGGRRTRALRQLKWPKALALVVDVPIGIQSYKIGFDLNTQREDQTAFDNAVKWRGMLDEGLFATQRELGEALGVDEGTVAQTLALAKIPEHLMAEMVLTPEFFGRRLAYEIGRYYEKVGKNADRTLELIRRVVREELSLRDVMKVIARDTKDKAVGPAQRSVFNHRIEYRLPGGEEAGELKTYGLDRLDLQLKGLSPEMREALQQSIEEILAPLRSSTETQPKSGE